MKVIKRFNGRIKRLSYQHRKAIVRLVLNRALRVIRMMVAKKIVRWVIERQGRKDEPHTSETLKVHETPGKFEPRMVDGKLMVPVWKAVTCGPDYIAAWMPYDEEDPHARYFA